MPVITVVNVYGPISPTHYCGRSSSYKLAYGKDFSILGNPFYMKSESFRNEVCNKFDTYFLEKMSYCFRKELRDNSIEYSMAKSKCLFTTTMAELLNMYSSNVNISLGCFCSPRRCHCDSIRNVIINLVDKNIFSVLP